ncbi:hypothetical protein J2770_000169 [Acinetobacter calcoaceticus]|nr:hypothetical protein [Acinetobacter calcoaceticus]
MRTNSSQFLAFAKLSPPIPIKHSLKRFNRL